jgi:hypothetical protein
MVAKFEGGIEVMITDCGVSLSPVEAHLDGALLATTSELTGLELMSTGRTPMGLNSWGMPVTSKPCRMRSRSAR